MKTPRGFSLLELILYIAISGVILSISSSLFITLIEARQKHQAVTEVEAVGQQIVQLMTQTIRNAEAITGPTVGAIGPNLTLDVSAVSSDPTIFDVASNQLRITEGATAVPISSTRVTVSGFSVTNLSRANTPGVVRFQFTLTHVNPAARQTYNVTRTFYATASLRQP